MSGDTTFASILLAEPSSNGSFISIPSNDSCNDELFLFLTTSCQLMGSGVILILIYYLEEDNIFYALTTMVTLMIFITFILSIPKWRNTCRSRKRRLVSPFWVPSDSIEHFAFSPQLMNSESSRTLFKISSVDTMRETGCSKARTSTSAAEETSKESYVIFTKEKSKTIDEAVVSIDI
ncbi:hypothetical protein HNY73_002695 [Argiope bruennichi]|uniref:Uncharacterized protein n=1 Tax=Argiope bruennichi TaxID=94029 RepID=A0A8T0G0R0_ARGBR|nr:hypothetical protein HNY73_002695 [Argiope bruennichi]